MSDEIREIRRVETYNATEEKLRDMFSRIPCTAEAIINNQLTTFANTRQENRGYCKTLERIGWLILLPCRQSFQDSVF